MNLQSCKQQHDAHTDQVFLCALDLLFNDSEYKPFLIEGKNYFSWVPNGYIQDENFLTTDGLIPWSNLRSVDVDVNRLVRVMNLRFPDGHQLITISQQENENKLKYEKKEQFCSWYFGAIKKKGNRYYIKGGFAVSSKAGIGALFVIDVDDLGNCDVVEYHPVVI